jgi:hypothetical protein
MVFDPAARYWPLAVRTGVVPIARWGPGLAMFIFGLLYMLARRRD